MLIIGSIALAGCSQSQDNSQDKSSENEATQQTEEQSQTIKNKGEINDKDEERSKIANVVNIGEKVTEKNEFSDWQLIDGGKFTYKCHSDWSKYVKKNYNGKVETYECSKMYSGKISFDDGIAVKISFVPDDIAGSVLNNGEKWKDTILNEVKNEPNAQNYENNRFSGWLSMKNQKHTLTLIARYEVEDGYYEVIADAMGGTKTDLEFKKDIDDIISTFKLN